MMKEVHIIPTFHHDIAYLNSEAWYENAAIEILDKTIELMQKDRDYTFTVEQAYFFRTYWEKRPEKHQVLKTLVKSGQLHFSPGFWVVPDMSMPSGESLFMQATLGKSYLENTVGYHADTALIADCFGHHAQLPQIMKQCGYEYYIFSRCMEKTFDKENFVWQGLDGTKINAHWLSTAYAGLDFPDDRALVNAEELNWERASKEGILSIYQKCEAHCGDEIRIIPAGGDMKYPAESALRMVKALNEDKELPRLRFSSFHEALSQIDFSQKPIYRGEFVGSLKGSLTTNCEIKQDNKRLENLLYSLETLAVLKDQKTDFSKIWETVLKNQFHDILCGSICDEAVLQRKKEHSEVFRALEKIRKRLMGKREKAVWFNTNPFPVDEVIKEGGHVLLAKAEALSAASLRKETWAECELPKRFENPFYEAAFDEQGFIAALTEKESGQSFLEKSDIPFGSLQLQADNGDNWVEFEYPWEIDATSYTVNVPDPYDRRGILAHPKAEIARVGSLAAKAYRAGEDVLQIEQEGELRYWVTKIPFKTTVTFYKNSPRIDYHTELKCLSKHVRVRVAFPIKLSDGVIRHQIPFGIVERKEGPQCTEMFMDCENDRAGLSLLHRGIHHSNVEGGMMMLTLLRAVAMEYKCKSELSYGLGETFSYDYAIYPHPARSDERLWQQALALNRPLIKTGEKTKNSFRVKNARVSALRFVSDDVFLRIYNGTAEAVTAEIEIPEKFKKYALTDGCMKCETVRQTEGNKLRVELKPFEVTGLCFIEREGF